MNNPPAFPQPMEKDAAGNVITAFENHPTFAGMTLRDWFAGMALQGMLASVSTEAARDAILENCDELEIEPPRFHAEMAYAVANAMLAAREKQPL